MSKNEKCRPLTLALGTRVVASVSLLALMLAAPACNGIVGNSDVYPEPLDGALADGAQSGGDGSSSPGNDTGPSAQEEASMEGSSPSGDDGSSPDAGLDGSLVTEAGSDGSPVTEAGADGSLVAEAGGDGSPVAEAGGGEPDDTGPGACAYCVPGLPTGWSGPIAYALGASGSIPTSCDATLYGGQAFAANAQLQAEAASCSSCATTPTGQSCQVLADLTFLSNGTYNCASPSNTNYDLSSFGTCAPLEIFGQTPAVTLHNPTVKPGTCTPPKQNPTVPAPKWAQGALGCSLRAASGTCATGSTCVDGPATPFGAQSCVYTQGDVACPSAYSGYRGVVYQGVTDTRSCSACGASYGDQGCTGSIIGNSATDCSGTAEGSYRWGQNWTASSAVYCTGAGQGVSYDMSVVSPSCNVSGGQPTGAIAADTTTALTVCCTP